MTEKKPHRKPRIEVRGLNDHRRGTLLILAVRTLGEQPSSLS
jgi:hypothetical protein